MKVTQTAKYINAIIYSGNGKMTQGTYMPNYVLGGSETWSVFELELDRDSIIT